MLGTTLWLLVAAPWPAEWTNITDPTDAGISRSAAAKCTGGSCEHQFRQDRDALLEAWKSHLVTKPHRDILLKGLALTTDQAGTDWTAARQFYIVERAKKVEEDAPLHRLLTDDSWYKRPPPSTTTCRTYHGLYSSTTTCKTDR